jgi:hypothetical protein
MKRFLLALAVGSALVAGLVGAKATISAGADNGITAVVGGLHRDAGACFFLLDGTPTFCSARTVDVNIDAHGLGSGLATGTLLFGTNGTTFSARARITCMTVVGNKAVVGGFITADTLNPEFVGDELLFYVIDSGGPGNAPLDKMSGNEITTPDAFTPGFPRNCGPPISTFTGYTDVHAGDVSIHAGL